MKRLTLELWDLFKFKFRCTTIVLVSRNYFLGGLYYYFHGCVSVPYEAVSHGPACIQFPDLRPNPYSRVGQVDLNTSEDCLYLNLWTPHNNTQLKPVMVRSQQITEERLFASMELSQMEKIDVVNIVHRLARDVDIAKRRC